MDPASPLLVEDYRYSFGFLKALPCDVFLATQGIFFNLAEKHAALAKGGHNPYLDPDGYRSHINLMERSFYYKLDAVNRH